MIENKSILFNKNEFEVLQFLLANTNFNCNTQIFSEINIKEQILQLNLLALKNKITNKRSLKQEIKIKLSRLEMLVLFLFVGNLNSFDDILIENSIQTMIDKLYFNLC